MNTNKAPGIDKIRMKDIKSASLGMVKVLTKLLNASIRSGTFPDCQKVAVVRPIHKNKEKYVFKNYRPISILPSIEKILEKYVLNKLKSYLKENNLIHSAQFGFQKTKSTEQALEVFTMHVNYYMNNRSHILALFIDLSKAFDLIGHDKILQSLYDIGVRGIYLQWFKSYLQNRKF